MVDVVDGSDFDGPIVKVKSYSHLGSIGLSIIDSHISPAVIIGIGFLCHDVAVGSMVEHGVGAVIFFGEVKQVVVFGRFVKCSLHEDVFTDMTRRYTTDRALETHIVEVTLSSAQTVGAIIPVEFLLQVFSLGSLRYLVI